MTRGFGKGWQTLGEGGCGLKGLWSPTPCSPARELGALERGRILRVASAGAWRLGFFPPLLGLGAISLASLLGRASCLASLDAASSSGPFHLASMPRVMPAVRSPLPLGDGLMRGVFTPGGFGPSQLQLSFLQEDFPVTIVGLL